MTEIEVDKGQNIINLFFDDFASCLVVKRALVVNWPDCRGSVGEYYAISDFSVEERNFYTQTINKALSEGSDSEQLEAIKAFLNLFSNGSYFVNKYVANIKEIAFLKNQESIFSKEVPENERFSGWFLPAWDNDYPLQVYSITNDKIDPNRVEHYCGLIKKGAKPTILTFGVSNTLSSRYSHSYVLDGHHKIEAYLKLGENIPIMSILKSEACQDKTSALLQYARPILKDWEYKHLFENNDENLPKIDFIHNAELTADLDHILENAAAIDLAIILLLKKYAGSKHHSDSDWLEKRLNKLRTNKNLHAADPEKGLRIFELKPHEKYGECWFTIKLNTTAQLNTWIENTLL